MTPEIIYLAQYNPQIEESAYATLSIHRTEAGAERAIALHKIKIKQEYDKKFDAEYIKKYPYDKWQDWCVTDSKLEE